MMFKLEGVETKYTCAEGGDACKSKFAAVVVECDKLEALLDQVAQDTRICCGMRCSCLGSP